jgi:YtkA-like protein
MTLPQRHRDAEKEIGRDGGTERCRDDAQEISLFLPYIPPSFSLRVYVSLWLKLLAFLGLALCANVLHSGCRKTSESPPDIVFEGKVAPDPPTKGPATVTLKLADSAGKPIVGARVNLEGNMSHPGMRPVFGEASEVSPGRYESALEFTMGGDWVILFHITLPDGRNLQRQIDVKGVRSE